MQAKLHMRTYMCACIKYTHTHPYLLTHMYICQNSRSIKQENKNTTHTHAQICSIMNRSTLTTTNNTIWTTHICADECVCVCLDRNRQVCTCIYVCLNSLLMQVTPSHPVSNITQLFPPSRPCRLHPSGEHRNFCHVACIGFRTWGFGDQG